MAKADLPPTDPSPKPKRRSAGEVYQRPDKPGWWASLTSSCGRRRLRVMLATTKKDAQERLGEARRLKRLGQLTPEKLDDFRASRRFEAPGRHRTLADAWSDWEAAKGSKKSFADDRSRWRILTEHLPSETRLRHLTPRRVDDALGELARARGISPASLNRYRALLRSVLRLQEGRTELGLDPKVIRTTREAPRERVLEEDEVRAILAHVERLAARWEPTGPKRALWYRELAFATRLALVTAAREGELGALVWEDVDLRGGTLHFRETKAGGGRTVPLGGSAVELLRAWKRTRGEPGPTGRVLVTDGKSIGRRFGREARAAGIVDARFHDLRRTAASRMLESGIDARTVQRITGHRDLSVLLKVYHRATDARRREAAELLSSAFGGEP